jgi:hypothetical protein
MRKPYLYIPTAEEGCIVRRWIWRLLISYGAFVLAAFGLVVSQPVFWPEIQRSDRGQRNGSNGRKKSIDY